MRHKQDIKLDGSNPTLLSGYGAYGHIAAMGYDPTNLAWLERGGVIAVAHVRGGGAFGKEWHHAGRRGMAERVEARRLPSACLGPAWGRAPCDAQRA